METHVVELSRVGCKQMAVEKRGIQRANFVRKRSMDGDIVSTAWKHAAVYRKTAKRLRILAKVSDEVTHLDLFIKMWNTLRQERPELFTSQIIEDCTRIITDAVLHEIVWGKYIISEGVLGLTDGIIQSFVEDLGNKRLASMSLDPVFTSKNQITWFDEASMVNDTDENSFETKVSAYETGALTWD